MTISVNRKLFTLFGVIFSSLLLLFTFLQIVPKSYAEENTISVPYSQYLYDSLSNGGVILTHDLSETKVNVGELGIRVVQTPELLERVFDQNSEMEIVIDRTKYELYIFNLAREFDTEAVPPKVNLLDGEILFSKGTSGKIIDQTTAYDRLVETLESGLVDVRLDIYIYRNLMR